MFKNFIEILDELIKINGEKETFNLPQVQTCIRKIFRDKEGKLYCYVDILDKLKEYKEFSFKPYNDFLEAKKPNLEFLLKCSDFTEFNIERFVELVKKSKNEYLASSLAEKHNEYAHTMAKIVLNGYNIPNCSYFLSHVNNILIEDVELLTKKLYQGADEEILLGYLNAENALYRKKFEEKYLNMVDSEKIVDYSEKNPYASIEACSKALLSKPSTNSNWQYSNACFVKKHFNKPECDVEKHLKVAKEKMAYEKIKHGELECEKSEYYINYIEKSLEYQKYSDAEKKVYLKCKLEQYL